MAELLPSVQAADIRRALTDYLATTFALADQDAHNALTDFILEPNNGMFRGPYLRTRLPFTPTGEHREYPWDTDNFAPYGHQNVAYTRLDTSNLNADRPRPQPTLVTTGTGSGKTESFLKPIVDHCYRMRQQGHTTGIKALILYPMNALANDQATRLAKILTSHDSLRDITAAKYTGEDTTTRTQVADDSLITDRQIIRNAPPDILLTNYKMLDQLLLRPSDQKLWAHSALSLRFLVLDEFHTYDGAQGTDVAMLIRRLGLALKRHWGTATHTQDGIELTATDRTRPLGIVTPVATSATLGDDDTPEVITDFASTIFGEPLGPDAVVTETRHTTNSWLDLLTTTTKPEPNTKTPLTPTANAETPTAATLQNCPATQWFQNPTAPTGPNENYNDPENLTRAVLKTLYQNPTAVTALPTTEHGAALAKHPFTLAVLNATAAPTTLTELAHNVLPNVPEHTAAAFLTAHIAALSHQRATQGRNWPTIETHLWVRELTRINRTATAAVRYEWHDDGTPATNTLSLPAIYCRSCGRSGWAIELNPTGNDFTPDARTIRTASVTNSPRFRPLIYAPTAAETTTGTTPPEGLAWLNTVAHSLEYNRPEGNDSAYLDGHILPVLTHLGLDAADRAKQQRCPSCDRKNSIRFVGSASSTLMSVSLSALFGNSNIDDTDKKALMFTDSVQDAAHRAAFVAARSHTMTRRTVLRSALTTKPAPLETIANTVITNAGDDSFARYRLVPPDFAHDALFENYWKHPLKAGKTPGYTERIRNRLLFDLALEIGLNTQFGRTLEQTGAVAVHVDIGSVDQVAALGQEAYDRVTTQTAIDGPPLGGQFTAWVFGVLDHIRRQGGVHHPWLDRYIHADGHRWHIWGGRIKHQAMPAFPKGRSAPSFPAIGPGSGGDDSGLDSVTSTKSWYARWTARVLGVPVAHAVALAKELLVRLARHGVLTEHTTQSKTQVFSIPMDRVRIQATDDTALAAGHHYLVCPDCKASHHGSVAAVAALTGAPCFSPSCAGRLQPTPRSSNYYRDLYAAGAARRLVAAEHTSVLPDKVRIKHEEGFKKSGTNPDAPNVLAATPTLEMGIDIGDLSTVFLASLPRSVANYVQRVGRAGRATGNALNLAYVKGRGTNLARLGEPATLIGGAVRPPATYLSAEEILRRQFIAFLCDTLAATPDAPEPGNARSVLESAADGTYFGHLLATLAANPTALLDTFFTSFAKLPHSHSPDSAVPAQQVPDQEPSFVHSAAEAAIREWATPTADGTSGLSTRIHTACALWAQENENLTYRRKNIEQRIPALQADAEAPAAIDEDIRAFHAAKSEMILVGKLLDDLTKGFWVAALEECGLLPVYTLLGDDVQLDVSVTVIDPDTDKFDTTSHTYKRASSSALSDFAPGSTFYVEGLAIDIDTIDLGPSGTEIPKLLLCPDCGYHLSAPEKLPTACPRCGSTGIADTAQTIPAVELTHVSAEVRRDEAHISDTTDERVRTPYEIVALADIDPDRVRTAWFVDAAGFGVKYLESVDLTWVNVGRKGTSSLSRSIAGNTHSAPLFRVCEECGHLDGEAGANHPRDHRPWCGYRTSSTEHSTSLALTRSLTTQGVLLRLPNHMTAGDPHALANLGAALRMGLTDHFGGDPAHLALMYTRDPDGPTSGGNSSDAILLHDVVPGGSGYLTDVARPEVLYSLLHTAWQRLVDCTCQYETASEAPGEARLACHRCLLPHVVLPHEADVVSRVNAARHLHTLLTAGTETPNDATPPETMPWTLSTTHTPQTTTESALEQHFRAALRERCETLQATITSEPGPHGNTDTIRLPSSPRVWRLEPQVTLFGCRPDFMLRCDDRKIPDVAIFTDGKAYHATLSNNRIGDDIAKRETLRDTGHFVLSITAADLDGARTTLLDNAFGLLPTMGAFASSTTAVFHGTPMDWLTTWLKTAEPTDWERVTEKLPIANIYTSPTSYHDDGTPLTELATNALDGHLPDTSAEKRLWLWRHHELTQASRLKSVTKNGPVFEHLIVLDDRDAAVLTPTFDASWRAFLTYRNAIQNVRSDIQFTTVTNLVKAAERTTTVLDTSLASTASPVEAALTAALPAEFSALLDQDASPAETALLHRIHNEAKLPVPEFSVEAADGIPITFAWPEQHVGIMIDPEPEDLTDLLAGGWTVVDAADHQALAHLANLMEHAS